MDQVHSLINRLTRQVAANVHSAELLSTIEMLRQEILKAGVPVVKQGQSVYVWMPGALTPPKTNGHVSPETTAPADPIAQNVDAVIEEKMPTTPLKEVNTAPEKSNTPIATPSVPKQVYAAPNPPQPAQIVTAIPESSAIPAIEEKEDLTELPVEKEATVTQQTQEEISVDDEQEEFTLDAEPTEEELAHLAYQPKVDRHSISTEEEFPAPGVNLAFMKVQELAAAKHAQMTQTIEAPPEVPFSKFHGLESRVKSTFPVAPAPKLQKEINELVVDESVPLNQKLKSSHTELGEMLATGPRIADLRKAFGINERYQFINGLFRGDGDMFDRSLRTLNNFGNHQEASFWMQRELVIKLGWNEEDELVQQFYKILARRF